MTTIAVCLADLTMVSDTKVVCGDGFYPGQKVYRFGDALVGICGEGAAMGKFMRWAEEGRPPVFPEIGENEGQFRAVVLTRDGIFDYDESFYPERVRRGFHAIGSGAHAALAAMMCGRTPAEAVTIACAVDNNSGLPVDVLKLEAKRARK